MKRYTCFSNQWGHFSQNWCTPVGKLFINLWWQCILSWCLAMREMPQALHFSPVSIRDHWSRLVMSVTEFSPQIKEDTSRSYCNDYTNPSQCLWMCCENGIIEHQKMQGSQIQILRALIMLILILAITVWQIPLSAHKMSTQGKNGYYFYLLYETDNLLFLACYIYHKTTIFKKL